LVVNLKGDVAGYYYDANGFIHGFIRNAAGAITTVDVPGDGNQGANISGIDAAGDAVGAYFDALEDEHSFVRSADGTITTFDPPNSNPGSGAQSINDNGTVAGGFLDSNGAHGYLRAPDGTFTTFDPTGSGVQIEIVIPFQITASGAVAGTYTDISYVRHGFLRDSSGSITILDAPGAVAEVNFGTDILGMNASGTIVGGIGVGVVNGIGATHSLVRTADGTYTIFDPPQGGGTALWPRQSMIAARWWEFTETRIWCATDTCASPTGPSSVSMTQTRRNFPFQPRAWAPIPAAST
jgi:uncharacterized membrane protein